MDEINVVMSDDVFTKEIMVYGQRFWEDKQN